MKEISFSPVTRLSGLLSVDVFVEGRTVVDARVKGNQFRGFEYMLKGRNIRDAPYFTERICGICSFAHGVASSYLLDELYGDQVPGQAQILRNIMLALEFLQNHLRHFYAFSLPDFIVLPKGLPYQGPTTDRRFDPVTNRNLTDSYLESFGVAAWAHEAQTLFGGKAPHQHGMVDGGVTVPPTPDKIMHARSLVSRIKGFIAKRLIPDTQLLSEVYCDYFEKGLRPGRYLSYGLFKTANGKGYAWPSGLFTENALTERIDPSLIREDITSSWYRGDPSGNLKPEALPDPAPEKPGSYTFVKAVHYKSLTFEGGPLARFAIRERTMKRASTMDRILARTLEAKEMADLCEKWLRELEPGAPVLNRRENPVLTEATALTDAPRGPLLHSAVIDGETIKAYGIITPTVWNFSPRNQFGKHGPAEQALIGTVIENPDDPVEIGRIIRAFDPCLSCGSHVIKLK